MVKTEDRIQFPVHLDPEDDEFLNDMMAKSPYSTSKVELIRSALKFMKAHVNGQPLGEFDNIFVMLKKIKEESN